ncbi:hypothetical protein [Pseudoalteromonas luteoviolacea]|uniref:Integrating conjugative element protein n=1 Tax=Pseudoalteromonas luteoviolacea S4060-1 TaxID=1365257 RepID=A0A162AXN1_9GAMM|nr:hypothetical protein [Pseudoalteromonas luteoviolacea]KZN63372.1 hypothetical protein N478_03725 [Pseudoalteromonas luteoviolacea S4060-1]
MQMKFLNCLTLFFCFSFLSIAEETNVPQNHNVSTLKVKDNTVQESYLKSWGISQDEYDRYLYLKNNTPRGYFTPNSNPIYYLGIEARSEAERNKYARLIAKMEYENFEKVQEFSKLIQKHQSELYASEGVIDPNFLKEAALKASLSAKKNSSVGFKSYIYVDTECVLKCKEIIDAEIFKLVKGRTKQIHIIFPDSVTAESLNIWANKMQIPYELNERDAILLRTKRGGDDENVDTYPTVKTKLF